MARDLLVAGDEYRSCNGGGTWFRTAKVSALGTRCPFPGPLASFPPSAGESKFPSLSNEMEDF